MENEAHFHRREFSRGWRENGFTGENFHATPVY
jgi:hypothetical protein